MSGPPLTPAMRADFANVCEHGGFFCKACQRFVSLNESAADHGRRQCGKCGSYRVKFCPPIPDYHRDPLPGPAA